MTDKEAAWFNTFNRWAQDHVIQLYHAASFSDDKQPDLFDYEDPSGISKYLKWYYPDLEILGTGAYAVAVLNPLFPDVVIRLSLSNQDYKGWWKYMEWVLEHDYPYTPRIFDVFSSGDLHTALLQRYYPNLAYTESIAVVQYLISELKASGFKCNDIHPSNIMITMGGEPVLTDPEA